MICTRSNCMGSVAVDTGPKAASSHNHSSGSLVSVCQVYNCTVYTYVYTYVHLQCTPMWNRCTQLGLCYGAIVPGNYHTFACQGSFNDMCFMVRNCIVCSDTQSVQLYATAVLLIRRALQIVFYQCALHCCYVVHIGPLAIHTSSW